MDSLDFLIRYPDYFAKRVIHLGTDEKRYSRVLECNITFDQLAARYRVSLSEMHQDVAMYDEDLLLEDLVRFWVDMDIARVQCRPVYPPVQGLTSGNEPSGTEPQAALPNSLAISYCSARRCTEDVTPAQKQFRCHACHRHFCEACFARQRRC